MAGSSELAISLDPFLSQAQRERQNPSGFQTLNPEPKTQVLQHSNEFKTPKRPRVPERGKAIKPKPSSLNQQSINQSINIYIYIHIHIDSIYIYIYIKEKTKQHL